MGRHSADYAFYIFRANKSISNYKEIKLFQQFEAGRQRVTKLFNQLPPFILEQVRTHSNRGRSTARKSKPGMWWSPMDIAPILEQIQEDIQAYQRAEMAESTASDNRAGEGERLE